MSFKSIERSKRRYRVSSGSRFIAVILFFLLVATAVFVVLGKNNDGSGDIVSNTPISTPAPTPVPTPSPPPIVIPEDKTMAPATIIIDPGHGGIDAGTVCPFTEKLYEKDITLYIAKKVEKNLEEKGFEVILTREGDDHFSDNNREDLRARAELANLNDAALFVSIHVNAYDLKYKGAANVNGMEIYYLNKDIVYTDFTEELFAQFMGDEISKTNGIKFNGIRSNDFSVLRNTEMPAVLIETAYITNKEDNARLASNDFRDKTAQGIADGIEKTLQEIEVFEYDGEMCVFKEVGE